MTLPPVAPRRLPGIFRSGACWTLFWLAAVVTNLPRWAYASPAHGYEAAAFNHDTTLTLGAVHAIRLARARGAPTLLLAGSSVARHVPPAALSADYLCVKAMAPGGAIASHTALTRILIDAAPADVVLVPLVWPSFREKSAGRMAPPGPPHHWRRGRAEQTVYQLFGYGHPYGLHRLTRNLGLDVGRWLMRERKDLPASGSGGEALRPIPDPEAPPEQQRYYRAMARLPTRVPVPEPAEMARLERLQEYARYRGVTVLYYLSPHNPGYFASLIDRAAFEQFRQALAPVLFADVGSALPREVFRGDFVHFNAQGGEMVSALLASALRDTAFPPLDGSAVVPGWGGRWVNASAEWRAGYGTPPRWRTLRQTTLTLVAELRLRAGQYPRYVRTLLGRSDPGAPPPGETEAP